LDQAQLDALEADAGAHGSDEEAELALAGKDDDADSEFKLVGVVCHMGLADAGHYLSYINVDRDREDSDTLGAKTREEWLATDKQKWLEFNDSSVTSFAFSNLENTCFGGQQNQNAYMLIYEKRVKEKMKVVIPQEVMQALACDGTAMTSADFHLFEVFPKLKEQIMRNRDEILHHDPEKDEHFAWVDFHDARKFVPNKIYKKVHADNRKFLSEKQVFSDAFYKCTSSLLQLSMQSPKTAPTG
jgi:ubiquitin carboxyl-terminal hydrolase 34